MDKTTFDWFSGGIVISCQAPEGSPLRGRAEIIATLAEAAGAAGALGIRAEGAEDIAAICSRIDRPVIGIRKHIYPDLGFFITGTKEDVDIVADAGAPIVAIDSRRRTRPSGQTLAQVIEHAHQRGLLVMADLESSDDGSFALDAGADSLGTTMIRPSADDLREDGPNIRSVAALREAFATTPIIAEGRYSTAADLTAAFEAGATTVVIGTAVTDPFSLTRRLVQGIRR